MSFMEKKVTEEMTWLQVDTRHNGLVSYPGTDFSAKEVAKLEEVPLEEVKEIRGYGARLSAPGYMDCTEWVVFETSEEAEDYLEEMYGDEED